MKIISHLMGGLGNQMFQYAVARSLQHMDEENRQLSLYFEDGYRVAVRRFGLDVFNIHASAAVASDLQTIGPERRIRRRLKTMLGMPIEKNVYREKRNFVYDPGFFRINSSVYLVGFWQSYRYFQNIREVLTKEFELKDKSQGWAETASEIAASTCPVSLHIRRGDYLQPASGFSVLSNEYYHKAIDLISTQTDRAEIFVFTDDVPWAQSGIPEITGSRPTNIVSNRGLKAHEELSLISLCHHNIIANSSFSWWGAWLNQRSGKLVVAPRSWNGIDNSIPLDDLIPKEWNLIG